jgi:hypothetical protein
MNNLPKEFFEWLVSRDIFFSGQPAISWFEYEPLTCQLALVVEWLEVEEKIRVFPAQSAQGIYVVELRHYNTPNNEGKWDRVAYPVSYKSRNEATQAGINKALELIE